MARKDCVASVGSILRDLQRHRRAAHQRVLQLQRAGREAAARGELDSDRLACIGCALKATKQEHCALTVQIAYWRRHGDQEDQAK